MYQSIFTDELKLPFPEALDIIVSWGLQHVDLRNNIYGKPVHDLNEAELRRVKSDLDSHGLTVGALESSLAKVHMPDNQRREEEAEKLEGIIRTAEALECQLVRSFFYWQPDEDDAGELANRKDYLEEVLDMFAPLAERARDAGLKLAFENCGVTTDEVLAMLEALDEPGWGLAWDVSNEWLSQTALRNNFREHSLRLAPATRLVHVKARGAAPKLGDAAPYDDVLQILDNSGFDGPVSIETHYGRDPVNMSKSSLDTIRRSWPSAAPGMMEAPEPSIEVTRDYKPVGFVVVGLGMGRKRAKQIQSTPGAKLVGVCDIDEERAKTVSDDLGVPYSTDLRYWLDDDEVEALFVVTPSGSHVETGLMGIEAGKNVLVTKPMDTTMQACSTLVERAEEKGLLVGVGFQKRLTPEWLEGQRFVEEGKLGRLLGGEVSLKVLRSMEYFRQNGGWRGTIRWDGGGVLSNQCVHHLDQVVFFLGLPEKVRCDIQTQNHDIEGEDLACADLMYANEARVKLYATTSYPHKTWYYRLELHGTEGAISMASGGPLESSRVRYYSRDVWSDKPPTRVEPQWLNMMDNFAAAIRTGAPLVCSGRDGMRTQSLLAALYESGREKDGEWVEVK